MQTDAFLRIFFERTATAPSLRMVSSRAEITREQIRRWLLESWPSNSGGAPAPCLLKPVAVRNNSQVFYAECTAFPSPMLVKLCLVPHTDLPDPDTALRQYEALLRVSRAMGEGAELSVPRPYLVCEETGMLAAEWISGTSMTHLLLAFGINEARAQELMERAGRWLGRFHACHELPPARLDVDDKLNFIDELNATRAVSDRLFLRALNRLRDSASAAASIMGARSWVHGDFKTDNLILSGSRTIGIDIHLRNENAVIYDLASFLNHLELCLYHPRGWRLFRSRQLLHDTFLAGYLGGSHDPGAMSLAWVQLYMLLGPWSTASAHGSWRSRFAEICYRGVASRLISWIERRI